jgi:CheY-like chemotaxis protein
VLRAAPVRLSLALTAAGRRTNIAHPMPAHQPSIAPARIAFLGFSDFERTALASYFRLAAEREPRFEMVYTLTDADYLVADADHGPSVQLVLVTERLAETVFIGSTAPAGAAASMRRPIDALHVMKALSALVQARGGAPAPVWPRPAVPPAPSSALASGVIVESMLLRAPPPASPAPPARAPRFIGPPAPPRALVVDDSDIARRFLVSRLQPWGVRSDTAATSDQVVALLERHNYELIFLDIELGPDSELDGLALCRLIKRSALAIDATVVVVSAHHSEIDRARGALAGCDVYLGKPIQDTELATLLRRQRLVQPANWSAPPAVAGTRAGAAAKTSPV